MASREKENRTKLRAELERRLTAAGYKLGDIFPELGAGASSGARRKRPAKYRDPQNPETHLERHRTHSDVGAGDPRGTRNRHGGVQIDPAVSDSRLGLSRGRPRLAKRPGFARSAGSTPPPATFISPTIPSTPQRRYTSTGGRTRSADVNA